MFTQYWWSSGAEASGFQVGNSLRFRGGNNGNNAFLVNADINCPTTFTYSAWTKLCFDNNAESAFVFFSQSNNSGGSTQGPVFRSWCQGRANAVTGRIEWWSDTGTGITRFNPQRFRDSSAWYHVVLRSDGTNVTLFVNGEQVGVATNMFASVTGDFRIGKAWGDTDTGWGTNFPAYLADVHFLGVALEPEAFGQELATGQWVPRQTNFTSAQYGANGFHLDFHDRDNLGEDVAPTGTGHTAANNFTATGFNTNPVGIFSNDLTAPNGFGGNPATNAFVDDGSFAEPSVATDGMTFRPATAINYNSLDLAVRPNTVEIQLNDSATWESVTGGLSKNYTNVRNTPGTIEEIRFRSTGGGQPGLFNIRINSNRVITDNTGADYDHMTDSPTQNFATLNPLWARLNTLTRANLSTGTNGSWQNVGGTIVVPAAGEFYYELRATVTSPETRVGFQRVDMNQNDGGSSGIAGYWYVAQDGSVQTNGTADTATGAWTAGDVIGVIFDRDDDEVRVTRNGTNIQTWDISAVTHEIAPFVSSNGSNNSLNFGQQPFLHQPADTVALQTQNLPAATIRDGREHFRAIAAAPTRTPGANDIPGNFSPYLTCSGAGFDNDRPAHEAFDGVVGTNAASGFVNETITWRPQPPFEFTNGFDVRTARTNNRARINGGAWVNLTQNSNTEVAAGNGTINTLEVEGVSMTASIAAVTSNDQRLVDAGPLAAAQAAFANGLWWIKDRDNADTQHQLVDSVRGQDAGGDWQAQLCPERATAPGDYIAPAGNSVAWCWSAPDTWTNAVGTGGAQIASSGRRNTAAGFSIINWSDGNGTNNRVGHGLNAMPWFVLYGLQVNAGSLGCMHFDGTQWRNGTLNRNNALANNAAAQNPNATTISNFAFQDNDTGMMGYAWTPVVGYSAFGSFQANNSNEGPFVFLGFRPALLICKGAENTENWVLLDSTRGPNNLNATYLMANQTQDERDGSGLILGVDFLSNGFKCRGNNNINTGTGRYIYAAWAEMPTGGSNTSPANAR